MRGRLAASLLLAASAGAWPVPTVSPSAFDFSGTDGRYVVLLNLDALNERAFHEALQAGDLPNVSRLLREKGGHVGRLVSSFPSSSAPAIPEFFHGRFLDRSATLPRKVHAFDRVTLQSLRYTFKDRDWVDDQLDIWDICAAGGLPTTMFYLRGYDGVGESHFRQKYLAWDSLFEFLKMPRLMNFDKRSLKDAARVYARAPEVPRLSYIWCDTLDVGGHIHGPYSDEYRRGLRDIDRGLGWLFDAMRGRKLPGGDSVYDRASVLIFGDHGLTPSAAKVPVGEYLKEEGLRLRDTSHVKQFISEYLRQQWAARVDAVFVPGGSTVAELYVRPRNAGGHLPWTERLSRRELERFPTPRHPGGVDLVAGLAGLPGVDVVLSKESEDVVRVSSAARGDALVIRQSGSTAGLRETYAYVSLDGGDPFEYLASDARELVTLPGDSRPRLSAAPVWLQATIGSRYPFATVRIPHAFGLHATESDLILVARPGWDFLAHSRGDHGGLDPETMITPLLMAGPGSEGPPALRTTLDMLPTMLDLLGIVASREFTACLDGMAPPRGSEGVKVASSPVQAQRP